MRRGWLKIKNEILGGKYDLSVAFLNSLTIKELNRRYRKKSYPADVLSFPLSDSEGEILINKKYRNNKNYADFLFIHSLLHLKGYKHGAKMELEERKIIKKVI